MISLPAPAKINLFLHIIGRRMDGYHELQTIFQFIDFFDELEFRHAANAIQLECDLPGVPMADNLVQRAAEKLKRHAQVDRGARIRLHKNLPMGAGLGGGSSDAATTLHGLNLLWQLDFSVDELAAIGAQLGADVPVFVRGQAAWAEGIGERLTPMKLAQRACLLVVPPVQVPTVEVFQNEHLERNCAPLTCGDFSFAQTRNVCEPVACALYPAVSDALQWSSQFGTARLTGTGGAIFILVADNFDLQLCLQQPRPESEIFLVRTLNQSPLLEKLRLN
jgi:4-diphosphocytidyl-2-C-methyl-D-erythritol kinase